MENQFCAVLDDDTEEFLLKLASVSGAPVSGIISRVLGASMPDLSEYLTWMLSLESESDLYLKGKNLMVSYGPESLVSGIRRLDLSYTSAAERFAAECCTTSTRTFNSGAGGQA